MAVLFTKRKAATKVASKTIVSIAIGMEQLQQEKEVSKAFSRQSPVFDAIDDANSIILWMRDRVRKEVANYMLPQSTVLELNCGTGIDSVYFAKQGHSVLATDNAEGMLNTLNQKIAQNNIQHIETMRCSFNNLENIQERQFDYVFSNFGGLNCTDKLDKVLTDIDRLLKPGGYFSLVIMPTVCPWEMLMLFKGYFKTAFRRFKKHGADAHLEGVHFQCYYYNPSYITSRMQGRFQLKSLKALSLTVPPPYIEHFMEKHPKMFKRLARLEDRLCRVAPFNNWGDHYIITMQKK